MMLRWRSRVAAVTLIAFIVLGTTGSGHAADYRLPGTRHTHTGTYTRVCPPTDRASSDQCAVCHWLQSLRFDPGAVVLVAFGTTPTQHAPTAVAERVLPTFTVNIPARAPPA